jgi:DNA-binding transcriptional LysR family regulator
MDVRQLDMFRAVAEEGSFTRAAQRLHISQSAVTRQVQLLEQELGTLLLHRTGRGVTITREGEILLGTAKRIDRDIQDVVSRISETQTLQRGSLTLAGGMTVCLYILPKLLRRFRSRYKNIDLRVISASSETILRQIRQHEIDLALLTLPIVAADMEVQPVLKEEMVVVTARKHALARQHSIEPRALGRYPLVLYESGSNTRKVIDEFLLEAGVPSHVVMETENVEIIKAMVASGLGVSIIPYAAIAGDLRSGRFNGARIRTRRLYRETGWIYLRADHQPRAITEVMAVFTEIKNQFGAKPGVKSAL